MVVLLVFPQVLGQGVDPGGEDSDLDLGRTGIAGVGRVLLDNGSLFLLLRIIVVFPPFKIFLDPSIGQAEDLRVSRQCPETGKRV